MADFRFVPCPRCSRRFMAHEEFFRIPEAFCHCPYCGNEFPVGAAEKAAAASRPQDAARQM